MKKETFVLEIFNFLIKREYFTIESLSEMFLVSRRTVIRYIKIVKEFVKEHYDHYVVYFDKTEKTYKLRQM